MAWTTVPTVTAGTVISPTTFGNKVSTATGELQTELTLRKEMHLYYSPASTTNSSGSDDTWNDWLTLGNVAIPTGTVAVAVSLTGAAGVNTSYAIHLIQTKLGGVQGAHNGAFQCLENNRIQIVNQHMFTSFGGAGSRSLVVQTQRVGGSGTGRLSADANYSVMSAFVRCYGL